MNIELVMDLLGYCYFKGLLHTVNEFEDYCYICNEVENDLYT